MPFAMPKASDDFLNSLQLRLWSQLLLTVREAESDLRILFRTHYEDTTLPRFEVLAALLSNPRGLRMSDLSQELAVSNGNVTGVVNRLIEDGLATRTQMEDDRRAQLVRITPLGRDRAIEMVQDHQKWIESLFEGVSEADLSRLLAILLELRAQAAEAQEPAEAQR